MTPIRFEKSDDERNPRVNFIPLIDIVLQIICFYIFVSAGVQAYQNSTVQLPTMTSKPLDDKRPAEITINLESDGRLDVNGRNVDIAQLPANLIQAKAKAAEAKQNLTIAVRADRRQRFATLDRVLQACRDAGVSNIALRAVTETAAPKETRR